VILLAPGIAAQTIRDVRLDEWVPVDHLLRKIDAVMDLSGLPHELAPFYSHAGRRQSIPS
jgi:hypothetical protein